MIAVLATLSAFATPREVLLVVSPGVSNDGFVPVAEALLQAGHRVHPVSFPCAGQNLEGLSRLIRHEADTLENPVIAAHGLGALVALHAAPPSASHYVLLAPTLGVGPSQSLSFLAAQPVPTSVTLDPEVSWQGGSLAELLLGVEHPSLTCLPRPFAVEVRDWLGGAPIPLPLEDISVPVWVGVSLGDNVASVEAVVPASRRLSSRRLVRFGINRFDPVDFSHSQMLLHPIPIRAAVHAVAQPLSKHSHP